MISVLKINNKLHNLKKKKERKKVEHKLKTIFKKQLNYKNNHKIFLNSILFSNINLCFQIL
jgi:late competence protein required for DNA uptake (superfamily II DNA/RNA helicase)